MAYEEYKKYKTLSEWWEKEGRGRFPAQICIEIAKMKKRNPDLSFQEAFEVLLNKKAIIFLNDKNKN